MEQLPLKKSQWLQERLTSYPRILVILYLLSIIIIIGSVSLSPSGLVDFMGYPLGRDFSYLWVASSLAQAGSPAEIYNLPEFLRAQEDFFKVRAPFAWSYPPTFLLIIYPLAWLPYFLALAVWLGLTMTAFLLVMRRIAPHPRTIWLAIAFPGTFVNIIFGQNGFFSAALLGGGLLLLEQHPLLGGFLLGLLSYKPHLVVLVPLALIAARQWKALLALAMGALVFAAASYLAFGANVWSAFLKSTGTTMKLLENQSIPTDKMITIFATALHFGATPWIAWILQMIVSLGVAAIVAVVWYKDTPFPLRASVLVLGILLATPYGFPYDLVLLALPLAWMGWEEYTKGWVDREPEFLFFGWLSPIIIMGLNFIGFNFIATIVLLTLMVVALRRIRLTKPTPARY
jgi:hypothetical protein